MFTLLDKLLFRAFVKAWLICFISLVSLYLVIDAFQHLDDFLHAADNGGTRALIRVMAEYYSNQIVLIFDRLCGPMTLLAALFTVTWMQKSNEITPLLAAGIPVRRVLRPVFLAAVAFIGLATANRELLLPEVASELQKPPDDPSGRKLVYVGGLYDSTGILIEGYSALPAEQVVHRFSCTLPSRYSGNLLHLKAKEAYYIPPGDGPQTGGWLLVHTQPEELPPLTEPIITMIDPGKFFLKTHRVTFELLTRAKGWHEFAATADLHAELDRAEATQLSVLAMQLHLRFTAPAITLLSVLLGLGMLLRDQYRNVFFNLSLCLAMAALLFVVTYAAKYLGAKEYLEPALAAWLPILLFGPFALVRLDAMRS